MLIGAHVGVSGGYPQAVDYAVSVGCECMQVFAKSPRQWNARPLDPEVASAFRRRCAEVGMGPVVVHTAYLINLGSVDDALWERSWRALADELARAETLGAALVVTHLGTQFRADPGGTHTRIAAGVAAALRLAGPSDVRLLLENTAGAGTTYGSGPEELGAVLSGLGDDLERVGVCLDTCHAHAAGYDLSDRQVWRDLVDSFERCCDMPIEAVHANDCAFPPGEHKDRHAWIGDGTIGKDGFAAMFDALAGTGVPVILEMPGEVPVKDEENLRRLRELRAASAAHASRAV